MAFKIQMQSTEMPLINTPSKPEAMKKLQQGKEKHQSMQLS